MFRIYDGRTHFWQWDIDCKLAFEDNSITKVHFCNRTDECSLVCDVYEENGQFLVNVPNILLQTDWDIHVYAYDSNHTKHEDTFKVRPRSKPADYVYTETEIDTWDKLEERMDRVEATVTVDGVASAVEAYLKENPVEAGATEEQVAQIAANTEAITEIKSAGYITTIPEEYITENELTNKGFQTADDVDDAIANSLSDYATKDDVESAKCRNYRIANPDPTQLTAEDIAFIKEYLDYVRSNDSYMPIDIYITDSNTNLVDVVYCGRSGKGGNVQFRYFNGDRRKVAYYFFDTKTGEFDASKSYYKVEYDLATMEEVEAKGYATEKYVDDAIAEIPTGGGDVDLSNYYTKTETDTAINNAIPSLDGYATETYVTTAIQDAMSALVDGDEVSY